MKSNNYLILSTPTCYTLHILSKFMDKFGSLFPDLYLRLVRHTKLRYYNPQVCLRGWWTFEMAKIDKKKSIFRYHGIFVPKTFLNNAAEKKNQF